MELRCKIRFNRVIILLLFPFMCGNCGDNRNNLPKDILVKEKSILDCVLILPYNTLKKCSLKNRDTEELSILSIGTKTDKIPSLDISIHWPYPMLQILPAGVSKDKCILWLDISEMKIYCILFEKNVIEMIFCAGIDPLNSKVYNAIGSVRIVAVRGNNKYIPIDYFEVNQCREIFRIDECFRSIKKGDSIDLAMNLPDIQPINESIPPLPEDFPSPYLPRYDLSSRKIIYFIYERNRINRIIYSDLITIPNNSNADKYTWPLEIKIQ